MSRSLVPGKNAGTGCRMTAAGRSSGRQRAGSRSGNASGRTGKAQPPSTGHHLPFFISSAGTPAQQGTVLPDIVRVAAEELLGIGSKVELAPLDLTIVLPVPHRRPRP